MNLRRTKDDRSPIERVRESGYAVVLTALVLVPLMGFAGFAVDVGAWYSRASELQRAADAAALAGVVMQPDFSEAETAARAAAARNGFVHGTGGIEVNVSDAGANRLLVEIVDTDADLYFSSVFLDNVSIGRQAIAEFNKPVAMGSPDNTLGQVMPDGCDEEIRDDGTTCSGPGPHAGFFLDIGGPVTGHSGGEAITTYCLASYGGSCDYANPEFETDGYLYGIEIPAALVGQAVTIEIFNPSHADWSGNEIPHWRPTSTDADVQFALYEADGSGLTTPIDTQIGACTQEFDPVFDAAEAARWVTLCTFFPTEADVYPLRVRTSGFAGADPLGASMSGFSLRASSAGATQPSVYALNFLGIFADSGDVDTTFTFAEIVENHAGKTLRMRLFDAGDGSGSNFSLVPLDPTGNPVATCQYRHYEADEDADAQPWNSSDSGSQCQVDTRVSGTSLYNDHWLDIDIEIPLSYTCAGNCWWSVEYILSAGASFFERTTWSVEIVGDPVRLLE